MKFEITKCKIPNLDNMKNLIITILIIIGFDSCTKPVVTKYCSSCDINTEDILIFNNRPGFIVYLSDYNKYAIQLASYNDRIIYIPCKMPDYFVPVETNSVLISGKSIQNAINIGNGQPIKTTYTCVQLDTIFKIQPE
jgi:hypothetical protein